MTATASSTTVPVTHALVDAVRQPRRHHRIGTALRWLLVIGVGVWGVVNFLLHTILADDTAQKIGWPTGNPFQSEIAMSNLGLGVLGLLCFFIAGHFWTATVISLSVFYLGAAGVHIHDFVTTGNTAPGNVGFPFFLDIALPLVLIGLLVAYRATAPREHR